MAPAHPTDDDLMAQFQRGNQEAFAELVRRHRPWVQRTFLALLSDAELAEDLSQEAFLRVAQAGDRYRPEGKFRGWLKRIVTNLARDVLKKMSRLEYTVFSDLDDSIADAAPQPSERWEQREVLARMREAVAQLPDEQRLALVMRYYGDMSYADIAWALRCPVGTVKSRIWNGLARARQLMKEE